MTAKEHDQQDGELAEYTGLNGGESTYDPEQDPELDEPCGCYIRGDQDHPCYDHMTDRQRQEWERKHPEERED